MSDGRTQFGTLTADLWKAYRWLSDLPDIRQSLDDETARLQDEAGIRRLLYGYTFAYDSKDLAWILDHFTNDAVLRNNRRETTHSGQAEIKNVYEPFTKLNRLSYHRAQNFVIRITELGREGWFGAYFHAPFVGPTGETRAQNGRYFGRAVRQPDGRWRFAELCISVDHTRVHPAR